MSSSSGQLPKEARRVGIKVLSNNETIRHIGGELLAIETTTIVMLDFLRDWLLIEGKGGT